MWGDTRGTVTQVRSRTDKLVRLHNGTLLRWCVRGWEAGGGKGLGTVWRLRIATEAHVVNYDAAVMARDVLRKHTQITLRVVFISTTDGDLM